MEPCLQLRKFCLEQGWNPGFTRSVGQHLTHWAVGVPSVILKKLDTVSLFGCLKSFALSVACIHL